MNHAVRPTANEPRTTRAADGMERRAFTVEEVEAMVAAGIVGEDERFELIGGEMVPMSPKGARHEMVKIELNRWTSETLQSMACALFKAWFVDFDPVRANAERLVTSLSREIADAFPDSFQDSELGEIPTGWAVRSFASTVEIVGGGTPKTSVARYWGGDIPWFSVADAPSEEQIWVIDTAKRITRAGLEESSTRILSEGTTILSARGTVGRLALVGSPMAMNQSCYGLRGRTGKTGLFTYFATREIVASLQQHAHGSVFDTITQDTLASISLVMPPPQLVEAFEEQVSPMANRIRQNLTESLTLAALRNLLLPRLVAGQLRVQAV